MAKCWAEGEGFSLQKYRGLERFGYRSARLFIGNRKIVLLKHVTILVWNKPHFHSKVFPQFSR